MADDQGAMLAQVLREQFERLGAKSDLEALGIQPSPSDISAWLAATPRTRRRLAMSWAAMQDELTPIGGGKRG